MIVGALFWAYPVPGRRKMVIRYRGIRYKRERDEGVRDEGRFNSFMLKFITFSFNLTNPGEYVIGQRSFVYLVRDFVG
jgi:hypothetical protein